MTCPAASSNSIISLAFNTKGASVIGSGMVTASQMINCFECNWNGREWQCSISKSAGAGASDVVRGCATYNAKSKDITNIRIGTNNSSIYFPSGTVIEIYGENYA